MLEKVTQPMKRLNGHICMDQNRRGVFAIMGYSLRAQGLVLQEAATGARATMLRGSSSSMCTGQSGARSCSPTSAVVDNAEIVGPSILGTGNAWPWSKSPDFPG